MNFFHDRQRGTGEFCTTSVRLFPNDRIAPATTFSISTLMKYFKKTQRDFGTHQIKHMN